MHIIVSWDIKTEQPKWNEVDEKMKAGLVGYSWVRPLTTFYVIRISTETDRQRIRDRLLEVAKSAGVVVHFIVSPAMVGGTYDGYLPSDAWAKLKERSAP